MKTIFYIFLLIAGISSAQTNVGATITIDTNRTETLKQLINIRSRVTTDIDQRSYVGIKYRNAIKDLDRTKDISKAMEDVKKIDKVVEESK